MQTVTSNDGTTIAYDRYGDGPALILVAGALGYRNFKKHVQFAELLSEHCTVISYDRRGRGDSDEAGPFSVEREVEDIAALIAAAGGRASLFGASSGGALALRAAGADIGVERAFVYEVPFFPDPNDKMPSADYGQLLDELVAAGDSVGAAKHFMRNAIGIPGPLVALMGLMPMFKQFAASGLTLPYDWAAIGAHNACGQPLDPEEWASVTLPTLVAYGSKTTSALRKGSAALAQVLPDAELKSVERQTHNFSPKALAPVVTAFVADPAPVPAGR
jgi:pimeloyl-ACP methyl ester carboxylesterase